MAVRHKIKECQMTALVKKGVDTAAYAGLSGMHQGPAATKKLKAAGIQMAERQEVRHLLVEEKEDTFLLCLLDGAKGAMYWAFWRVYVDESAVFPSNTYKWAGYCTDAVARPA